MLKALQRSAFKKKWSAHWPSTPKIYFVAAFRAATK
jgi:hypothetical protein